MENPKTVQELVDAAWNHVEQIGLALGIGDQKHALKAKADAARLLSVASSQIGEAEYSGAGLIAAERQGQITREGWTEEHDDGHARGEMIDAALSYIFAAINVGHPAMQKPPREWPWASEWWKPSEDRIRNLTKAGALIAAEIDRLNRKEESES